MVEFNMKLTIGKAGQNVNTPIAFWESKSGRHYPMIFFLIVKLNVWYNDINSDLDVIISTFIVVLVKQSYFG